MARKKRPARHRPFESATSSGRFIKICHDMMQSPAWKALSRSARYLYIEFKAKYTAKYSSDQLISENARDLSFPASEAGMLYGDLRTFRADVDALINCGFIDLVESGQTTRTANIYGLSERWKQFGQPGYEVPHTVKRPTQIKKTASRAE